MKGARIAGNVVVGALRLALGCDSCSHEKNTHTTASVAGPVIVTADGGKIQAATAINEELAGRVAGPIPKTGKLKAATSMAVDCKSAGQPVSPTIFGIAWADTDKDIGVSASG